MVSSSASLILEALWSVVPKPGLEHQLAEDVRKTLLEAGIAIETESTLTKGRVDLRVESTAIELKIQGSLSSVLRQLQRYAEDPEIQDIILVTTSAKLRRMPDQIKKKRLHVVYLPRL